VATPPALTPAALQEIDAPQTLLEHAWEIEPLQRWDERKLVLDRLEQLLGSGIDLPDEPPGRSWRLEYLAERAIDAGRLYRLDEAAALIDEVLRGADPAQRLALGRAELASGQALVWGGTDESCRQGRLAFARAVEHFEAIDKPDWKGSALLRWGYSGCYQQGEIAEGARLMRLALDAYVPGSVRWLGAFASYADALIDLGEFDHAETVLIQARAETDRIGSSDRIAELSYGLARIAAGRGDAQLALRLVRQTEEEAHGLEWFETHIGVWFLFEAAEMLDRLGLTAEAEEYLERGLRAAERAESGAFEEGILQVTAILRARSGDPVRALEELQAITRGDWLEKRLVWRHTLMGAWATFRLGRDQAGAQTARALQQALDCGTLQVAVTGEPDVAAALAPEAERHGSTLARSLLLTGDRQLVVRLFGPTTIRNAAGDTLEAPPGMQGELIRVLAAGERGLSVSEVLDQFFPDTEEQAARLRLRQLLRRIRASVGQAVLRDGERLVLAPAWVDLREFRLAAARARGARGQRAVQLAYAAVAIAMPGPLLPEHPYAEWAEQLRDEVTGGQLELLELIAGDAIARGSAREALSALEAAARINPDDDRLKQLIRDQLSALSRHQAAD
jgi:DNA-binding SARP family transcriptional activator/tetratricopeptide (TPR) repeat protein